LRRRDLRHIGRNAIDAVRDLIDFGFHLTLSLVRSSGRASSSGAIRTVGISMRAQ
jgi:hypothetical protein